MWDILDPHSSFLGNQLPMRVSSLNPRNDPSEHPKPRGRVGPQTPEIRGFSGFRPNPPILKKFQPVGPLESRHPSCRVSRPKSRILEYRRRSRPDPRKPGAPIGCHSVLDAAPPAGKPDPGFALRAASLDIARQNADRRRRPARVVPGPSPEKPWTPDHRKTKPSGPHHRGRKRSPGDPNSTPLRRPSIGCEMPSSAPGVKATPQKTKRCFLGPLLAVLTLDGVEAVPTGGSAGEGEGEKPGLWTRRCRAQNREPGYALRVN